MEAGAEGIEMITVWAVTGEAAAEGATDALGGEAGHRLRGLAGRGRSEGAVGRWEVWSAACDGWDFDGRGWGEGRRDGGGRGGGLSPGRADPRGHGINDAPETFLEALRFLKRCSNQGSSHIAHQESLHTTVCVVLCCVPFFFFCGGDGGGIVLIPRRRERIIFAVVFGGSIVLCTGERDGGGMGWAGQPSLLCFVCLFVRFALLSFPVSGSGCKLSRPFESSKRTASCARVACGVLCLRKSRFVWGVGC